MKVIRPGIRIALLRISIGIIFIWFGGLKFIPGLSPAEEMAVNTIQVLTFDLIPPYLSIFLLASWECLVGLGLVLGIYLRYTLVFLFLHMVCTIFTIFIFPDLVFTRIPYAFTLEGQYIMKNIIIISAALVISSFYNQKMVVK